MNIQEIDIIYMKMALRLAKLGEKRVYPNPMVGCVIVNNNKVISKGHHEYFGGPHAEINAINKADKNISGSTLYVTLEPCSHWGKTPPCADKIIKSGIKRVVVAMKDPNPDVFGIGIKKLIKNNIEVKLGVLEPQARKLNKRYLNNLKQKKSRFILKMAMSLDGKIATRTGDSKWISGPKEREFVHKLRSQMDGIIVGVNTVIKDNPNLSSHGKGNNPIRIIIDPQLKLPLGCNIFDETISTIIIYSTNKAKDKLEVLASKKSVLPVKVITKSNVINFKTISKLLHNYGIHNVLLEGGGETAARALLDKVVDEVFFVVSAKIIGGRDAKTPVEGFGIAGVKKAINIKKLRVLRVGKDFIFHGYLK